MFTVHHIIRDQLMGSKQLTREQIHPHFTPGHIIALVSCAYLCPTCGDVWARVYHEATPDERHTHQWTPLTAACDRCGSGRLLKHLRGVPPGQIIRSYPDSLIIWESQHIDRGTQANGS